jgi:uncharacterized iron-regulated membrane protein
MIFWTHFTLGLAAGVVIAVMAVTGASMAFREPILAWADRGAQLVAPAPPRLPLQQIVRDAREARPDTPPVAATVFRDPSQAVMLMLGRGALAYANPYDGTLRDPGSPRLREFFDRMERWHRFLGLAGERRAWGLRITSACSIIFALLLASGLVLWWPRTATAALFRLALRPRVALAGRARDWNWHTTAGFWLTPVLVVTLATGITMAYASRGDEAGRGGAASAAAESAPHKSLPLGTLVAGVESAYPSWESVTVRLGGGRGSRSRGPLQVAVLLSGRWPALPVQVSVEPSDGRILSAEDPRNQPWVRWFRGAARGIHTGDATGTAGRLVVLAAALTALLLVVTGVSLAARRISGWARRT